MVEITTKNQSRRTPALHVAMVSPEITPFAKTGGLGDVLGSLPPALEKLGLRLSLVMPAYRSILKGNFHLEHKETRFSVPVSNRIEKGTVLRGWLSNTIPVYFVRSDKYFDREGLYATRDGDYPDNAERFTFFSRAVLEVLRNDPPSVLHAHDWQSALSVVFLKAQPEIYPEFSRTKTVFTVHNLGYQGVFWSLDWHLLNLDWKFFTPEYLEFFNKINFLKGAVVLADRVTTVSPTYAKEITTTEQGFGLEGVFQVRSQNLTGILNGADYSIWNPETDTNIAATYNENELTGKAICKKELQKLFSLDENPEVPIVSMVTRLTSQKGSDIVAAAMSDLMARKIQFVMLGNGEEYYSEQFRNITALYPGKAGIELAFDDSKVHKIIAGADMILLPSHYEPCGLTQMYSLRYGTVPVVRETGGLKDTVHEFNADDGTGNGFLFASNEVPDLLAAVDRALSIYQRKDLWAVLVKNGMIEDYSWDKSALAYKDLYTSLF
jgi:starch synthase